jgi:exosortase
MWTQTCSKGSLSMATAGTTLDISSCSNSDKVGALRWIKFGTIAGLVAVLYWDVIGAMASEWWKDPSSSYGMLIPPITLYIAYSRRAITRAIPARQELRGLWVVMLACALFFVGGLAAGFFLSRISLVLLLAGLAWTFWGLPRLKTLAFPLLLLGTMVPPPALMYPTAAAPLQLLASSAASELAQAIGITVFREGNIIHLANLSLGVVEACSGLQSLSALVVASLLLGYLLDLTLLGRTLLFVLAVPLAIAVNVLRVAGTAVLADYKPEFAMGYYHLFSGWLVFTMGFGLLWMAGKVCFRWTRADA